MPTEHTTHRSGPVRGRAAFDCEMEYGMRNLIRILSVSTLLVLVAAGVAWGDDREESPCAMCHDDIAADMATTPHGVAARGGPSCEDCHGDGEAHMDEGGEPSLIGRPSDDSCRSCHRSRTQPELVGREVHHNRGVDCFACHTIHDGAQDRRPLLRQPAETLCFGCHTDLRARFNRPYGHRLDRAGVVACVSCHDPHGTTDRAALKVQRDGEGPCFDCHSEKRGPFVFQHGTRLAGDCMSCHEPHGSNNPNALKRSRVDLLCLECHSPIAGTTLGSQPPSIHDLRSPRYRQCTVCHVAIHGSNSSPALLK